MTERKSPLATQAHYLYRRLKGDDHPDTLISANNLANRLAALRRARAAWQQGHALIARDRERGAGVGLVAGNDDADGENLIDRGIGRVTAARRAIEQDIAPTFRAQASRELACVERRPGTLQRAVDGGDARLQQLGDLGCTPAQHLAQDQDGTLLGR